MAGTLIIHLVVLVLMLFMSFSIPPPPEIEEGLLVNFGTDLTGEGLIEPSAQSIPEETAPPVSANNIVQADEEPLLTQNMEEAPVVKKVDPEAEKKRTEQIEAERIRREQLEVERKIREAEEAERRRIEAEQKRQTDIANKTINALANSRNSGTNSTGEGVTGGEGNQGVTNGSVDSRNHSDGGGTGNSGISYDLGGRKDVNLPKPLYNYQEEGKVILEVSVDRSGKVIAVAGPRPGSTTLDENLVKAAMDAAKAAQFVPDQNAPQTQKGTITYNFVLK